MQRQIDMSKPKISSTVGLGAMEVLRIKSIVDDPGHYKLGGVGGFVREAIYTFFTGPAKKPLYTDVTTRDHGVGRVQVGFWIEPIYVRKLYGLVERGNWRNYGELVRHITLLELERRERGEPITLPERKPYTRRQPILAPIELESGEMAARVVADAIENQPAAFASDLNSVAELSHNRTLADLFCCGEDSDDE